MATNYFSTGDEKMFCVIGHYTMEHIDFVNKRRAASSYPSEPLVPGVAVFLAGPYSTPAPAKQQRNVIAKRNKPYTHPRGDTSYDRPMPYADLLIVEGSVPTWQNTGL